MSDDKSVISADPPDLAVLVPLSDGRWVTYGAIAGPAESRADHYRRYDEGVALLKQAWAEGHDRARLCNVQVRKGPEAKGDAGP